MSHQRWTDAEIEILREKYPSLGPGPVAEELGRPRASVVQKACRLSVVKIAGSPVSDEEKEFVRQHYHGMGSRWVAERLGRSVSSVQHIAERLHLPRKQREGSWTAEEIEILKADYPLLGPQAVATRTGRTIPAVVHRAKVLGVSSDLVAARARQRQTLLASIEARYAKEGIKDPAAWKRRVRMRDNYTCADCGLRDPLVASAHHIIPKTEDGSLALDVDNGVTLCPTCHTRRHVFMGRKVSGKRLTKADKTLIVEMRALGRSINEIAFDLEINHKTVSKYLADSAAIFGRKVD